MAIPYEQLKSLASQKRSEYGVVTTEFGLQKVRSIYRDEGITLDYRATKPKIRAIYMCDDDDPSVMINKALPEEPKLFSLVHELKHHYLDRSVIEQGQIKCGDYNANQDIEIAAEVFAAEFIYPESEFLALARDMGLLPGKVTAGDMVRFKRACGAKVSYTFLRKRFERLRFVQAGLLAKVQFKNLEEKMFGTPIYKQPGFLARRSRKRSGTGVTPHVYK
jgi:Zn-dependent peptidase ImmA (M78 family)